MPYGADIVIIGAGIAGLSAAAEMAGTARVRVLEMESQPGYHASGRSAAFFAAAYGNEVVRALTAASEPFYRSPPAGFCETRLLQPRECYFVGRADQQQQLTELRREHPELQPVAVDEARRRVPILSADYVNGVLCDALGGDLDVAAILQGYLRLMRTRGASLHANCQVRVIRRVDGIWELHTDEAVFRAPVIVNAAGAWADPVAELAGIGPLGVEPRRRTAVLVDLPSQFDASHWPMVVDVEETFYFKPDAGRLLISPADETPSPACDAQADELDVAIAVERFERVSGLPVARVQHRWAGLRSFVPDRTFVVGFDPRGDGFFWLAGQGGYGVQSAPALSRLAASLINGDDANPSLIEALRPGRLLE